MRARHSLTARGSFSEPNPCSPKIMTAIEKALHPSRAHRLRQREPRWVGIPTDQPILNNVVADNCLKAAPRSSATLRAVQQWTAELPLVRSGANPAPDLGRA